MTAAALKDMIITKAWEDAVFKAQLLADPKGTIKQAFGVELPEDVDLEAISETSKKFYVVIPPSPIDIDTKDTIVNVRWM
jgi:hypothetical protein